MKSRITKNGNIKLTLSPGEALIIKLLIGQTRTEGLPSYEDYERLSLLLEKLIGQDAVEKASTAFDHSSWPMVESDPILKAAGLK